MPFASGELRFTEVLAIQEDELKLSSVCILYAFWRDKTDGQHQEHV